MKIPVLIEPLNDNGYRAVGLGPGEVVGEGHTEAEALANLRDAIANRIRSGARLTYLDIEAEEASLAAAAGIFQSDDRLVQEWKEIMAENRRRDDAIPELHTRCGQSWRQR